MNSIFSTVEGTGIHNWTKKALEIQGLRDLEKYLTNINKGERLELMVTRILIAAPPLEQEIARVWDRTVSALAYNLPVPDTKSCKAFTENIS